MRPDGSDRVILNSQTLTVVEKELHVPVRDGSRVLYLAVRTDAIAGGFNLWGVELPLLESLDALDGQRIHLHPDGEAFEDDTLGTDILGCDEDFNLWCTNGRDYEAFQFGELKVDFQRVEGRRYRVLLECTLTDSDEYPQELGPEDYWAIGSADVIVEADEKDPYDI